MKDLTITVPCYNSEKYLKRCLDSLGYLLKYFLEICLRQGCIIVISSVDKGGGYYDGKGDGETKNFYFKYNNGTGYTDHFSSDQCVCDKGLFGNY